jgi:two-component system, NtrC family, nitrogen regulation sensor histidine kinase NtrY
MFPSPLPEGAGALPSSISINPLMRLFPPKGPPRRIAFLLSCIGVLWLALVLAEAFVLDHRTKHEPEIANALCEENLSAARREFVAAQSEARDLAARTAADVGILDFLKGKRPERSPLFDRLFALHIGPPYGVEVYNRDGERVAWDGRSGPDHPAEIRYAIDGRLGSGVARTPVLSEFFVVMPVRGDGAPIGAVLVRRTLELNYPFTNKFLVRGGLQDNVNAALGADVDFHFGVSLEPTLPKGTSPLYGLDSTVVGSVTVTPPDSASLIEGTHEDFVRVRAILLAVFLVMGGIWCGHWIFRIRSLTARCAAWVALLWGIRVLLLVADLPGLWTEEGVLGPAVYAGAFGWGLARSAADLLITAATMLASVLVVIRWIQIEQQENVSRLSTFFQRTRLLLIPLLAIGISLALALYGGLVSSMVLDSTVQYSNETAVLPSLPYLWMALSGLLFGFVLLILCRWMFEGMSLALTPQVGRTGKALAALLLVAASVFPWEWWSGVPLLYRYGAPLIIVVLSIVLEARRNLDARIGIVMLVAAGCLWYSLVEGLSLVKDRRRVETFAGDVLRPVDGWFVGIVEEALNDYASAPMLQTLDEGNPEETSRLAFTVWARSRACREGYASVFSVTDVGGANISRFAIGAQSLPFSPEDLWSDASKNAAPIVRESGAGALRAYAGVIPIKDGAGNILGYGRVLVAAARQSLFRGETPSILRSTSSEGVDSYYRPIHFAEFRQGVRVPSEASILPVGAQLPAEVAQRFRNTNDVGMWVEEVVGDLAVETYYIRAEPGLARVIGMSMERPALQWYVASAIKLAVTLGVVLIAAWVVVLVFRVRRGERLHIRFRDTLLVALLVIAAVPLIVVTLYTQWFAQDRLLVRTARDLSVETAAIAEKIAPLLGAADAADRRPSVDAPVARIAADLQTDFNLYLGDEILSSSVPALYDAGILDQRISGRAYQSVVLAGRPFQMESEGVGEYPFAVGYRPVIDSVGTVMAVVSVPTLFREDELRSETSRTTTFVLGLALVVLLLLIPVGTAIANSIAAPIQRLTAATAQIASGDLEVKVERSGAGAELRELMQSFEGMAHELRANRDALVRFQRDLAWKEVARRVAHEIRNPLTPMRMSLQHLRQAYHDGAEDFGERLEQVVKVVIAQVDALSRITTEFSQFARMPKRVLEACDVTTLLNEAVALYSREPRIKFLTTYETDLPPVRVDREEFRRIVINLIRNGVQAMGGSGKVEITARKQKNGVEILIRDHGPGLSPEAAQHLFEPGFTSKSGGTGLGLAIVKSAVDDMKGTMVLESSPDEGVTVRLWLPGETSGNEAPA